MERGVQQSVAKKKEVLEVKIAQKTWLPTELKHDTAVPKRKFVSKHVQIGIIDSSTLGL